MRWIRVTLLLRLTIALSACALAPGVHAAKLRVMGFSGTSNWPVFVGQAHGFFAKRGVDVEITAARNSATQLRALASGEIDIALTAMDNVIAADASAPDAAIVAVAGVNQGGRSRLVVARDLTSMQELRGRALAVDAVDTGYAFVLMSLLQRGGVEPGSYTLVSAGSSRDRLAALQEGRVAGALLNAPTDAVAEAQGFRVLASSAEVLSRYQGSVIAVRRAWAQQHAEELVAFLRGYIDALEWLQDRSHREAAIAVLIDRVPGITESEAARSHAEMSDPSTGALSPRAEIDVEGVRAVLELRAKFGPRADRLERDPYRYYDASFYQRAIAHD